MKEKDNATRKRIKKTKRDWIPYTIATCSAVLLLAVMMHLDVIGDAITAITGFIFPVFLGVVFAYILNPLVNVFDKKVFKWIKRENLRWGISVVISYVGVLILFSVLVTLLVSQVVDSIATLISNMDSYLKSLQSFLDGMGAQAAGINLDISNFVSSSDSLIENIEAILPEDNTKLLNTSKNIGGGFVNIVLGMILALYFLFEKKRLLEGVRRLLHSILTDDAYERSSTFWHKCDQILIRYIAYSIIEAFIVGIANAIFMGICGMNYVALISVVVGVTNLAPTFGPIIGALVGALILLLVNPIHALLFLIFTIVLQTVDGYIIKPKLFGDTLGVSGLLILIGIIVGGKMFGVIGILLAIPAVAIIDYVYQHYLLKKLEERKQKRAVEMAALDDGAKDKQ